MCDRLAPSESGRSLCGGGEGASAEHQPNSCHSCSMNRQSDRLSSQISGSSTSTSTSRRINNNTNSVEINSNSDSINKRLLRLGRSTSKIISNPHLIIVLILLLAHCPGTVKAKPVGRRSGSSSNSRSTSQSGEAVLLPKIVSINPVAWFKVPSHEKVDLKQKLVPALLKMELIERQRKELVDALKHSKNVMNRNFNNYVEKYWYNDDVESVWSAQTSDMDWLGKTKSVEELEPTEELHELIEMYVRFQKLALGIKMIQEHNEMDEGDRDRHAIAKGMGETAQKEFDKVKISLDDFYKNWASEDSSRRELHDIKPVDDAINPHREKSEASRFHHYVILKKFLEHLDFSHKFVENIHLNRD